jgi:hypothetical protein
MTTMQPSILEEYEDNEAIGVEAEELETEFRDIDRPWDPESIRVSTKTFSLRNMLDLISEGSLDLAPDFQRLKVWKPVQKAQLIESVLLQIPLPAFYFAEDADGTLRVVDGVQRLSTIDDFVQGGADRKGGFYLDGLEYIADVRRKRFDDLPALWKRRIFNTQIVAHVIAPSTPAPVMYDIFRRINTGGTPLNAQEIRHCISKQRSRDFLKLLVRIRAFDQATGSRLKNQKRMIDREVALRFVAFWEFGPERYVDESGDTMDSFLLRAIRALDDPKVISNDRLGSIAKAFEVGLTNSYIAFGEYAFRKWLLDSNSKNPFNRALFEVWAVELARIDSQKVRDYADAIAHAARSAMTNDPSYLASLTSSTGDVRNVRRRFRQTAAIIDEVFE